MGLFAIAQLLMKCIHLSPTLIEVEKIAGCGCDGQSVHGVTWGAIVLGPLVERTADCLQRFCLGSVQFKRTGIKDRRAQ